MMMQASHPACIIFLCARFFRRDPRNPNSRCIDTRGKAVVFLSLAGYFWSAINRILPATESRLLRPVGLIS